MGYNMQRLVALLALTMFIIPGMAELNQTQTAFVAGLHDGYILGQLAWQSRGNETAATLHNHYADIVNEILNKTLSPADVQAYKMVYVKPLVKNSDLPIILQVNQTTGKWTV